MLLHLNIPHAPIQKRPPNDIRLGRSAALDFRARLEFRPEFGEVLQFDQVPDVGEWGVDDGGLADGG